MGFVLRREVTVGDIFATGSFLVAFVALGITAWQLWRESIRKRAEFVLSVTTAYHVDKGAQKMLYNIEYDEFKYDSTFHGSGEERDLDRLLAYFEQIAFLHRRRLLSGDDLKIVQYDFLRVFNNKGVKQYFRFLDEFTESQRLPTAFPHFREVAKEFRQLRCDES